MNARFRISDSIALIRNIKTTGTITPSSGSLIRELLASIDFDNTTAIVELGSGTGCVTKALLRRMRPDARLICMELDNEFVYRLNALNDKRIHVYNACASSIRGVLDDQHINKVDYIVSSLPLALMNDDVVSQILTSAQDNLSDNGRFLQYQYSLANYGDIKNVFDQVKLRFTLRNMPPAFVYDCSN
ncbi:MAG: rRNA adenine N-6-methyltransferase family protein [Pseudomonadales bacterium]